MSGKIILSFGAAVLFSASVFAHLPPSYDASLRTGQRGFGAKPANSALRVDYENKGEWSADGTYKGDFTIGQGDTVSKGDWKGKKLWWRAKFAPSASDIPGETPPQGGTSAWVLVNSLSAVATGTPNYVWKGWNGDLANKGGNMWAEVPTWRDGAQGAYSMTHDDIGAMPFNDAVKPGWDVAKDFPLIKQSWGVYVDGSEMNGDAWVLQRQMVAEGHEIFNHSMDHTSAADRWSVYNPGQRLSSSDPDVPEPVRGLTVDGAWKITLHHVNNGWTPTIDLSTWTGGAIPDQNGDWAGPLGKPNYENGAYIDTLKASNDLVDIYSFPYWEGMSPNEEAPNGGIMKIELKGGTEEVTLATGQKMYINKGANKVSVNAVGWFDLPDIRKYFPFYENGSITTNDKGRPGFVLKVHSANGWDANLLNRNVNQANDIINSELYSQVGDNQHFVSGKRSEYFGYPFDVYSETTHRYLEQAGFVGARGGAKSGAPMPGDFYHPYRIDFDAFFIQETDWTPNSAGGKYIYPENPHVLLGLNQLVDRVVDEKGYMIREFHAVANITSDDGSWYKNGSANESDPDLWNVNNAGNGYGGWWGGIAAFQLRSHYQYLDGKIKTRQLAVYTPSEAVKYRMTANATNKTGTLTKDDNNFKLKLTTTEDIDNKYRDEITVIVALDASCNSLAARYSDGSGTNVAPRRKPVKMDGEGKVWSVSVNPFRANGEITLIPNGNWEGVDGDGNINWSSSISDKRAPSTKAAVAFAGIQNGQIALNLQKGNYTAELYNLQGRLISRTEITAINGVNASGLKTNNLAKGMLILNVKQAGKMMLNQKIMVK
ncbi:MAG: T9SS type A sorting domain-containing protein [Chitinivibrionia bacterium]|nr:T9SS type A sorting domain-containing protein [Chitinivibrionia bacterium]